ADGLLVLEGLTGAVNEGSVAGDINVIVNGGKPHFTGQLTLDELNLEPLAAMVLGETALENTGNGWSSVPFAPKVSAPFSADLGISAAALAAGAATTVYDANLVLKLDEQSLRLADLSGKLHSGDVTGLFELKNNGGTGLFSGQMKLAGADIASILRDAGLQGSGDVSTTLSASGKSVGGLIATLSGSGTAAFRSLVVAGVNPLAFPAFIARADQYGKGIDVAKTAGFAPIIAGAGSFAADPGEAAFTIAAGVLRAPPITLTNPAATIEANLQSNFNSGEVSVEGELTYEPGLEALVGSQPMLRFSLHGPVGSTVRTFDSEPLAQFLVQRALETEQARVEAMQSALLEKQRLRREVRYYEALQEEHDLATAEWRREQEEARAAAEAEAEARRKAEEEARLQAEAEERARQAEAEKARLEVEEKTRKEAEERARIATEDAERQAAEAARLEAEAAARFEAEEKARLEAEAQAQRAVEEKARIEAEAARREADAAAKAEAETRARIEAERALQEERDRQERAARAIEDAARQEAESAPPASGAEGALRPRVDVGRPAEPAPTNPVADDGFMKMLQGIQ
nr:AsmA protein [Pseudomonadota bacterium]